MKFRIAVTILVAASTSVASAASIAWSMSPAVDASEVNNSGTVQWAYAFNSALSDPVTVNGVTFTRLNTGGAGGAMADANAMTPGFERQGGTSYGEFSDDFYLGPDASLNQLLDGLTWGGTDQFRLNNLTPGVIYTVQLFSSDDRSTQTARVLDLDSNWGTPNGSRQLEDIDYTAGGPWTDPAGRSKIFTGTFTADAAFQDILAPLNNGTGQIDLNAIQLRIPEPAGALLLGLTGILGLMRRRR